MKKFSYLLLSFCFSISAFAQAGLNFDGTDDHITSSFNGISGSADRTIEAWIRTTANSIPGNGGQKVIANWGTMSIGTRFTFNVLRGNAIRVEIGGSGVSGNIPVNDGNWHHVAATFKAGLVSLYVDGTLDTTGTLSGVNSASGGFVIGRRVDGINYFDGDIEELRVWDVALSPAQLAQKDSNEYCVSPGSLVAYYKFNDGIAGGNNSSINSVQDHSANANNGSLVNFGLSGNSSNFIASPMGGSEFYLNRNVNSCGPYTAINGLTYNSSGFYTDTIQGTQGCDTILDLNLQVTSLDSSAQKIAGNKIEANEMDTAATFQWLNCSNNYSVISGARNRQFIYTQNGSYAVEVSLNGCVDTSACIVVNDFGVSLTEVEAQINVYPNPSRGQISVSYPPGIYDRLEIIDSRASFMRSYQLTGSDRLLLDIKDFGFGLYFLSFIGPEQVVQKRIIKK